MTLVLIAVLAAAPAVWSQSQAAPPVPAEVPGVAGEGLHLYPLGWSSEGRWGALIGSAGTLRVVVIDAVTDEVLHESRSFPWAGPDAAAQFWRAESAAVMGIMKTFNLESSRQADVRDAEFITGGVRYTFALEPKSPADGTYTLKISSSRGDSKTVYRSPPASPPHRARLLGVLVSPFEERALAILREWPSSKDKPRYRFSGAHLTQGFSHPRNNAARTSGVPRGSLLTAVFNGQEYLVKSRLAAGADPDIRDNRGYPVVLIAARLGHWEIVIDLLLAGANPNPRDKDGRGALHHAAFAGSIEAVRALLTADADKMERDGAGRTPGELAADVTIRSLLR